MLGLTTRPLPFWPLAGIATLSVIRLPYSWPAIWGAALLLNLAQLKDLTAPITMSVFLGACSSLGAIVGAWVISRGQPRFLERPLAVWNFITRASLSTLLAPLISSLLLVSAGVVHSDKFTLVLFNWYLNDFIGILFLIAIYINFMNLYSDKSHPSHLFIRKLFGIAACCCILFATTYILRQNIDHQGNEGVLLKFSLLFCIIISLSFGVIRYKSAAIYRRFSRKSDTTSITDTDAKFIDFADQDRLNKILCDFFAQESRVYDLVTLALGNIDNLEEINANYGWRTGDSVIDHVGTTLALFREQTICIARLNSTEFALLFPYAAEQTHHTLEQIRAAVADTRWDEIQRGLQVSITFGFATSRGLTTPEELLQNADARLYSAKRAGKNRVLG